MQILWPLIRGSLAFVRRRPHLLSLTKALVRRTPLVKKVLRAVDGESFRGPLDVLRLPQVFSIADAVDMSMSVRAEARPFLIPAHRAVWGYGFRYTSEDHPWVAYLSRSGATLESFYRRYRPKNTLEAFSPSFTPREVVNEIGASGELFIPEGQPWLYSGLFGGVREEFQGESTNGWRRGADHGHQHLGPVSAEKSKATERALSQIYGSLEANGYRPTIGGWIRGYFLVHGAEFLFLICGGQHRAAAWVALGNEAIPVRLQSGYPRLVDVGRLHGEDRGVALCYFNDDYREARRRLVRNL